MPSLALCNAICRRSLASLESGGPAFSRRQLRWHRPRLVLVLELENEIGSVRSAISGTAQTPPFDYEEEDDYELLWRLSAVLSDEDDSQDLEWTGSSRKE